MCTTWRNCFMHTMQIKHLNEKWQDLLILVKAPSASTEIVGVTGWKYCLCSISRLCKGKLYFQVTWTAQWWRCTIDAPNDSWLYHTLRTSIRSWSFSTQHSLKQQPSARLPAAVYALHAYVPSFFFSAPARNEVFSLLDYFAHRFLKYGNVALCHQYLIHTLFPVCTLCNLFRPGRILS